jgi:putative ABC transport system substrate-binding protein
MRRREFIVGLGSATVWPLAARAQPNDRVRPIGVLLALNETDPVAKPVLSAFTQPLAGLGWTEGRNLRMDVRWSGGDANRERALAQELVGLQPDVILTGTTPATVAVQRETPTIPMAFATPSPAALSRGSTGRVGTSLASPCWKPRWEASGLSCSRRSRRGSSRPP